MNIDIGSNIQDRRYLNDLRYANSGPSGPSSSILPGLGKSKIATLPHFSAVSVSKPKKKH